MGSGADSDLVGAVWWAGALAFGLTSALALQVLLMRWRIARREPRRERVFTLWRPLLFEHVVGGVSALPALPARDEEDFLLLWNQLQDGVRGGARARLNAVAESVGARTAANRGLLFHPRGGAPGWLAFPVLLAFEALGPLVEVIGYLVMTASFALGMVSWQAFLAFMVCAVGLGLVLSACALLLEELSFHLYRRPRHLAALLAAMLFENLGYRQLTAWWRLRAIGTWLRGRPGQWGEMTRIASWQAPPSKGPPLAPPRVGQADSVDPAPAYDVAGPAYEE